MKTILIILCLALCACAGHDRIDSGSQPYHDHPVCDAEHAGVKDSIMGVCKQYDGPDAFMQGVWFWSETP